MDSRNSIRFLLCHLVGAAMLFGTTAFAAELASQSSESGGVTIAVKPVDVSAKAATWSFQVSLTTHSQELSDDLVRTAFILDRAGKKASIEVSVDTASVSTGDNDKGARARSRDEHLRSADFFNTAEFPRMTFKSTAATFNGDNLAEFDGQVTLLGVTKPLALKLERWKCGAHPFNKKEMCGGVATGKVKRTDFGMKYAVPAIGDEVSLMIGFEAYKD